MGHFESSDVRAHCREVFDYQDNQLVLCTASQVQIELVAPLLMFSVDVSSLNR